MATRSFDFYWFIMADPPFNDQILWVMTLEIDSLVDFFRKRQIQKRVLMNVMDWQILVNETMEENVNLSIEKASKIAYLEAIKKTVLKNRLGLIGGKSRKRRTKSDKKSRKQRKRTTLKGGKRKYRRTRRRR